MVPPTVTVPDGVVVRVGEALVTDVDSPAAPQAVVKPVLLASPL